MTTNEEMPLYYGVLEGVELAGEYNIPTVKGIKLKNLGKSELIGFNYATKMSDIEQNCDKFVHFFLPDVMIERIWDNYEHYQSVLGQYKAIIQPDFSQYVGMPKAMLIWQHYRRMWLSAYYQQQGLKVIPAPCWSDEESFEYCFDGMPKHSCICISTVGCMQNPKVRQRFNRGLGETIKRLEPSQIIFYGKIDDDIRARVNCEYVQIDSEMRKRINAWKNSL